MWLFSLAAHAATWVQWIPDGGGSSNVGVNGGTSVAADFSHPNITASPLFSRSQMWTNGGRLPHGYGHDGSTPNLDEYVEFAFSVSGAAVLNSITYDRRGYSGNGARQASIRWSMDNYASDLNIQSINPSNNNADVVFDLSSLPALVNPSLTFRVYFYDASQDDWIDLDTNSGLTVDGDLYDVGFLDSDMDGFGDPLVPGGGPTFVLDATDCNDQRADVYPGAPDLPGDGFRNDCSNMGVGDECYENLDGDPSPSDVLVDSTNAGCTGGMESGVAGMDCDDTSPLRYPSNTEVCDGIDNNCDETVDEGVRTPYFFDGDLDGFGDPTTRSDACNAPLGFVDNDGDCNDSERLAWTDRAETCDSVDNDCNGQVDEGVTITLFEDLDGDGLGGTTTVDVCQIGRNLSMVDTDCDDLDPSILGPTAWFLDADDDGFGDPNQSISDCDPIEGYVSNADDCDDERADVNPVATEFPDNGVDEDCDGEDSDPPPMDTGDVGDTDEPSDTGIREDSTEAQTLIDSGCACSQGVTPAPWAGLSLLVLGVLVRRRRQFRVTPSSLSS